MRLAEILSVVRFCTDLIRAGCSKRPSGEAEKSGVTEAYPRGYVARRHRTENDAGGLFQQPLRLNNNVHKRRHRIRSLFVRHPQLEAIGPFL